MPISTEKFFCFNMHENLCILQAFQESNRKLIDIRLSKNFCEKSVEKIFMGS